LRVVLAIASDLSGLPMLKSAAAKLIAAVAAFAIVTGMAVLFAFVVPEAKAGPTFKGSLHRSFAKVETLPAPVKGAACSSRSWPHYEQRCLFDRRNPAAQAPTIRVIAFR
jgi:hypothetical protein